MELAASDAYNAGSILTLSGTGTIADNLDFAAGTKLVFNATTPLTVNGAQVTFGCFGVANICGLDDTEEEGTYELVTGPAEIDWANISNKTLETAAPIGGTKSAYFDSGSLMLVVIPEPATGGLLVLGAAAGLGLLRRTRIR